MPSIELLNVFLRSQKVKGYLGLRVANGVVHRVSRTNCPHVGQTDQIDDDTYHLDPTLPMWYVVQDLYSTDPTQGTFPRS